MLDLTVQIREKKEKPEPLRKEGKLPAVLYGPKTKTQLLKLDRQSLEKVFTETGFSTLISIDIEGRKTLVLIHDIQKHPLTGEFLHVDFYQPRLDEKMETKIPLIFEGEAPVVKDLNGTLIKHIQELEVKALPQDLAKAISVNIESLKTLEDDILVKDLKLPKGLEVLRSPDEIVVSVSAPEKIEEELRKPIEEKVEEVGEAEEKEPEEKKSEEKKEKKKE